MTFSYDEISLAVFVAMLATLIVIAGLITYGMTHTRKPAQDGGSAGDPAKNPIIVFLYREPAMLAGVIGAAAALTATFGMDLDTEQIGAIIAFISIVLAIIVRQSVYSPDTIERSGLTYDRNSETLEDAAE